MTGNNFPYTLFIMLIIRLQRFGKKNQSQFRLVLAEHTNPIRGKFLEVLGSYDPRNKIKAFKKDRLDYWAGQGVKYSPTVQNLLISEGIISGKKVKAWQPKKKEQKEEERAGGTKEILAEKPEPEKKEVKADEKAAETAAEVKESKEKEIETARGEAGPKTAEEKK